MMAWRPRYVPSTAVLLLVLATVSPGQNGPPADAARRQIALERLLVTGRALYIGAHPDDENTAMLAWLAQGLKLRTAYLSLTRGDGGQNLIGSEQGDELGVIRTEELLAARRLDDAEQLFTRAADFGFSKTPAETLSIWGHDRILADVVYLIRSFRPDVIITRFPTTGEGGHGHHTASAILAVEAFSAAADPKRFPEQLGRVSPWRAKRLFWNSWNAPDPAKPRPSGSSPVLTVDLGEYNPLLGESYLELAATSRSMHKSQGFGSPARHGTWPNYFELLAGDPAQEDPFEGVDLSWGRFAGGSAVEAALKEARAAYSGAEPQRAVPALLRAFELSERMPADPSLDAERSEITDAIRLCAGIWMEAVAESSTVTCGASAKISISLLRRSPLKVRCDRVEMPFGAPAILNGAALDDNRLAQGDATVTIPGDQPYSNPYWLEGGPNHGVTSVPDESLLGLPRNPPALSVKIVLNIEGHTVAYTIPVQYRWTDPVEGERYRAVVVVPDVTVNFENHALLFATPAPQTVRLTARAQRDGAAAHVTIECPPGWKAEPPAVDLSFAKLGDERTLRVTVSPPEKDSSGEIHVHVSAGGRPEEDARQFKVIDHPHIPVQVLLPRASARLVRADIRAPVRHVGYVMGAGDDVPAVLRQLGIDVTLLTDADIEDSDLSRFDAIVTGVRAYNTRPRLAQLQDLLLRYVEQGGTLVVQYNNNKDLVTEHLAPFPLDLSRDRTTDETVPVTLLRTDHSILTTPNRIGAADFDGWIQERGLYYADKWDNAFVPLLEMADPGEKPTQGALLVAQSGKGTFVYTGLAFFRQLPAGVPGAVRLFMNLLAGGRPRG